MTVAQRRRLRRIIAQDQIEVWSSRFSSQHGKAFAALDFWHAWWMA